MRASAIEESSDTLLGDPTEDAASNRLTVTAFTADDVTTIDADASVAEAAMAMTGAERGLLVVGSTDAVEGVISERDVVRAVASGRDLASLPIRDIESTGLIWCDGGASVDEVAEMMLEHYVRHVLVETDGQFVGVVSARDLLGAYVTTD